MKTMYDRDGNLVLVDPPRGYTPEGKIDGIYLDESNEVWYKVNGSYVQLDDNGEIINRLESDEHLIEYGVD